MGIITGCKHWQTLDLSFHKSPLSLGLWEGRTSWWKSCTRKSCLHMATREQGKTEQSYCSKAHNLLLPTVLPLLHLYQFPEMLFNYYFVCGCTCGSVGNCLPHKHRSGDLSSILTQAGCSCIWQQSHHLED